MAKSKGETTKLVIARSKSDSLRITVPSFIVKVFHLSTGDEFKWELESLDEKIIKVVIIKGSDSRPKKGGD